MTDKERLLRAIRWDAPPPQPGTVYAPILSPKAGQICRSVVCCVPMVQVRVHWWNERTTGCIGRDNGCEACKALKSTKWKGYLGVYRLDDSRLWLAEITPGGLPDIAGIVLTKAIDFRGWRLTQHRTGGGSKGRVRYVLERPPANGAWVEDLPRPWDVRESLLLCWEQLGIREAAPPLLSDEEGGES
jgi:hypothetical protein